MIEVLEYSSRDENVHFAPDYYCLESRLNTLTKKTEWDLNLCNFSIRAKVKLGCKYLHNQIRNLIKTKLLIFTVAISGILMILATLAVYALTNSYHTIREKSEIFLIIGILIIFFSQLLFVVAYGHIMSHILTFILMAIGVIFTFLWSTILSFDLWWTFINKNTNDDGSKRFKFYCIYGIGTLPFLTWLFLTIRKIQSYYKIYFIKTVFQCFFALFVATILADLFMIGSTGFKIFQMSKASNQRDHAWFKNGKERCEIIVDIS